MKIFLLSFLSFMMCWGHEFHAPILESPTLSYQLSTTTTPPIYETLDNGMPILNSLPSATGAIFLDLDGGAWPYTDYDLEPYGGDLVFDEAEQLQIYYMWQDIATHFAMFDINVTTVLPNKAEVPTAHVLISPSLGGGASQTNVYGRTDEIARSRCHSSSVTSRSTCITHEIGHNLGLNHQSRYDEEGVLEQSYRGGDEWNRAPFMGRDNWDGVYTHWANNTAINNVPQNDIEKIAQKIQSTALEFSAGTYAGDGFRPDDYANSLTDATTVCLEESSEENGAFVLTHCLEGVIERFSDTDTFALEWFGGELTFEVEAIKNNVARPIYASSVGLNLRLLNHLGEELEQDVAEDPADVTATLTYVAEAGTYYIEVSGAGGEADLGKYALTITGQTTTSSAYRQWIKPYQGISVGYTSDPDGDLLTNIEEFGLGLDPTFPNVTLPYTLQDSRTLTIPMRAGALFVGDTAQVAILDGIQYTIQGSTDLITYDHEVKLDHLPPTTPLLPTLTEGYSYYNFYLPSAENRGFFRLSITPEE